VGPGDVLGVYIDGVLGKPDEPPPVQITEDRIVPPSVGFPIPVRSNGTLSLPLLKTPLQVSGLTLGQVEALVLRSYTVTQKTLNPENARVLVSLQQPRSYRIMVVRQEASNDFGGGFGGFNPGSLKRGSGQIVTLPAYENDVMHALAATQGLPGLDAQNTIYIVRQRASASERPAQAGSPAGHAAPIPQSGAVPFPSSPIQRTSGWSPMSRAPQSSVPPAATSSHGYSYRATYAPQRQSGPTTPQTVSANSDSGFGSLPGDQWGTAPAGGGSWPWSAVNPLTIENPRILTIPIRLAAADRPSFRENDVILQDGDIVFIESRDTEIFYTGGLLGGGQFTLPRDYDLDVLGAIAIAQGRMGGQMNDTSAFGASALNQDVSVSASKLIVLRTMPNGSQVPIKVDLYKALRNPAERLTIQPGDYLMLQYTPLEAIGAFMERYILRSAVFGLAASQVNSN
jgi:hypothetical protein